MNFNRFSKYNNRKEIIDGITFDSKKEAQVYADLKAEKEAGKIVDFQRQVKFELIPNQRDGEGKGSKIAERACHYVADFVVIHDGGELVVVDCKGLRTPAYKIKRKLMLWVHKIKIMEV